MVNWFKNYVNCVLNHYLQTCLRAVEVSIAKLEVGNLFRVRDLEKGDYVVTNTPEDTIVSVGMSRALKQAEQQAGKK